MKYKVWFIVLTYQPEVRDLVERLRPFKGVQLVLVDNSEKENEFQKEIIVLRTRENLGYAGGMNEGISFCLSRGAQWIVVVNEDIKVTRNALNTFVDELDNTPPGIAGPSVGSLDKNQWTSILGKGTEYISGSIMAIHKSVINKIGVFYEPYFIYYEDVEYCLKAKKNGFELIQLNDIKIHHEDSATMGKNSFLKQYYLARNHLLFVKRNAPLRVKLYEMLRMPKTLWEHYQRKEYGALEGIKDFALGKFGKKEGTL